MPKKLSNLRKNTFHVPAFDNSEFLPYSLWLYLAIIAYTFFAFAHTTHFSHIHPRLLMGSQMITFVLWLWILPFLMAIPYQHRCRGKVLSSHLKLQKELNYPINRQYPTLCVISKQRLTDALDGCVVKTGSTRPAVWQLTEQAGDRLSFVLSYDHTTLGTKLAQLYRRTLRLDVHVKSKGLRTELEMIYSAQSAMDYQTVHELIVDTNEKIKEMLRDDIQTTCSAA